MSSTVLLFKNPKMSFDDSDVKNHKVIAVEDINAGELLMVEKVFVDFESEILVSHILDNKELFDNLCPRYNNDYIDDDEITSIAQFKLNKNCFVINCDCSVIFDQELNKIKKELKNKNADVKKLISKMKKMQEDMNNDYSSIYAIGLYISKFNHCNIPNTNKEFVFYDKNNVFIYVIADKDIKRDEEMSIYYGDTCLESPNIYHSGIPANTKPYEKPQISTPDEVFIICDKYINSIAQ